MATPISDDNDNGNDDGIKEALSLIDNILILDFIECLNKLDDNIIENDSILTTIHNNNTTTYTSNIFIFLFYYNTNWNYEYNNNVRSYYYPDLYRSLYIYVGYVIVYRDSCL